MLGLELRFLVFYAGFGLATCLAVHVTSFFVLPPGGEWLLAGLFFGFFPAFAILLRLDLDVMQGSAISFDQGWRHSFERVFPNCPVWMRRVVQVLWFYAVFATLVLTPLAVLKRDPATNPFRDPAIWRVISAVLLLFYGAALAFATSTYRAAKGA